MYDAPSAERYAAAPLYSAAGSPYGTAGSLYDAAGSLHGAAGRLYSASGSLCDAAGRLYCTRAPLHGAGCPLHRTGSPLCRTTAPLQQAAAPRAYAASETCRARSALHRTRASGPKLFGLARRKPWPPKNLRLCGFRDPVIEDHSAQLQRQRPGGLQQVRQRPRRPHQSHGDVHGVQQRLVEQLEVADERAVVEHHPITERVGLLVQPEQSVAAGAGQHRRGEEGQPAVREHRRRPEPPCQALAGPEQAEAEPRDRLDEPGTGRVNLARRGRLVPLAEAVEEGGREGVGTKGRGTIVEAAHRTDLLCSVRPGGELHLVLGPFSCTAGTAPAGGYAMSKAVRLRLS